MNIKSMWTTKLGRLAVAGVVAAGAVVGVSIAANAAAVKPDCKTLSYPLCPRSVAAGQVVDNSLPASKIVPADRAKFLKDDNTPDIKGDVEITKTFAAQPIKYIGGGYNAADRGHTNIGTFKLPAGTWLVNVQAKFNRTAPAAAGDPEVQPMLQLIAGSKDGGTIMGNDISPALDADLTGSSVTVVSVTVETVFDVNAFGYNSIRGQQGSGDITAAATVVAVRA